jgi:hypothetical protein
VLRGGVRPAPKSSASPRKPWARISTMWCCAMEDDFSDAFDEQIDSPKDARDATPKQDQTQGFTTGVSLNDFVAYMPQHSYIFMPARELWPAASVNARVPPPGLDADGSPIGASTWLDVHQPVEQMTWAPGKPILVRDKLIADGGWIDRPGCTVFNLYKPPTIQPIAGDVTPWLDLIKKNYPEQADHLVSWLAHKVQAATRAAENGATVAQLNAIFGWKGAKMATFYTEAADRRRLSLDAMHLLANDK